LNEHPGNLDILRSQVKLVLSISENSCDELSLDLSLLALGNASINRIWEAPLLNAER
jgi:hypothetical protein